MAGMYSEKLLFIEMGKEGGRDQTSEAGSTEKLQISIYLIVNSLTTDL